MVTNGKTATTLVHDVILQQNVIVDKGGHSGIVGISMPYLTDYQVSNLHSQWFSPEWSTTLNIDCSYALCIIWL